MADNDSSKRRKRIKLQCLKCGKCFDDDYKKKHEEKVHNGQKIKVQLLNAPKNPFELARQNAERIKSKKVSCNAAFVVVKLMLD